MDGGQGYSPADVARRVTALGVIVDPAVVWSYLRTRFDERYPHRAGDLSPALLPVGEDELEEWLEDFLDGVERTRARLVRSIQEHEEQHPDQS